MELALVGKLFEKIEPLEKEWDSFLEKNPNWMGRLVVPFKSLYNTGVLFVFALVIVGEAIAILGHATFTGEIFESTVKKALAVWTIQLLISPISLPAHFLYGSYLGLAKGPQELKIDVPYVTFIWWTEPKNRESVGLSW